MKGIYIVDADMDFTYKLERLISKHLTDCKTLGHNLKGSEFLSKIKQQPDLLNKINLLIVNPKLNDMTGLALVEKVQGYKKDINVCITLKDNIKQFFINDLSEKGLEHVLIYPNDDEYFITNLRSILFKIEQQNKQAASNSTPTTNGNSVKESLSDVFEFLNSDSFLNQFNIDSMSNEDFLNNSKVQQSVPDNTSHKPSSGFGYEKPQAPQGFGYNEPQAPQSFNFGYEEPQAPQGFGYNEPQTPQSFGYEEPQAPQNFNFGYEEPQAPQGFGYNEPQAPQSFGYEEPQAPQSFNFGYEESQAPQGFGYNEPQAPQSFGYEEPQAPQSFNFDYEEPQAPQGFGYNEPQTPQSFGYEEPQAPQSFNFGYEEPQAPQGFGYNEPQAPQSFGYEEPQAPQNFNFGYEEPQAPQGFGYNETQTPQSFGYEEPQAPVHNPTNSEYSYRPVSPAVNGAANEKFFNREAVNVPKTPVSPVEYSYEPIAAPTPTNQRANNPQNSGLDMGMFGVENKSNPRKDLSPTPNGDMYAHSGFEKRERPSISEPQVNIPKAQPKEEIGYYDPPSRNTGDDYGMYGDNFNFPTRENQIKGILNSDRTKDLNYSSNIGNVAQNEENYKHVAGQHYNEIPTFAKQIIHFFSTKGGIGKTTVCVNAAIQLAKYSKKRICLVDFDLTNANLHTHLGMMDVVYDLNAISNTEIDGYSLSRIITPYRVKDKNNKSVEFDVIVGFREMVMRQRFNEDETDRILSILQEMYDIVIVDSHPVYTDEAVSTILKKSTKIIFITEQDLTALGGTRDFILTAGKYKIPQEKVFLVLNRYKSNTPSYNKKALEKTMGKSIMTVLPFDIDASRDAVNTNMPISLSKPDSELAKAYFDVAKIIDPSLVMPEESKGFFSFLGKK